MKASIVDLRYKTKEILRAIDRNETVHLLYRGKEKALIVPAAKAGKKCGIASHEAFGLWKDRKDLDPVPELVRNLRKSRYHDF